MTEEKTDTKKDIIPSHTITFNDEEKIKEALSERKTFRVICPSGSQSFAAEWLEHEIERKGFKCRIYTSNRASVLAAGIIPTGITQVTAIAAGVFMAAHNLATFNPDYEISKDPIGSGITVTYKK